MKVSPVTTCCDVGECEAPGHSRAAQERTELKDRKVLSETLNPKKKKRRKSKMVLLCLRSLPHQSCCCEQVREQPASAMPAVVTTTLFCCLLCPASREQNSITEGLQSFERSTCIRFTPHQGQRDFVDIQSRTGCWSFVGRRGGGQVVSLMRRGCVFLGTIQHELLHALGFNHEQTRSDRDSHVRILLQNVISGQEHNFRKIETRNLGTPYDYNSIMHYGRFAFSRNREPTILPIPDPSVPIGRATQMSNNDILRVNRLYNCSNAK